MTRNCVWPMLEQNCNLTKPFNYSNIVTLDQRMREFDERERESGSLVTSPEQEQNNTRTRLLLGCATSFKNYGELEHLQIHLYGHITI